MNSDIMILPDVFLRAPLYSFRQYDPGALPGILKTELFQNALYLASPAFYEFMEAKDFDAARLSEKETRGLWKYYNRMCFRPTPFGAFASFTLARWSREVTAQLADLPATTLHLLPAQPLLSAWRSKPAMVAAQEYLRLNPTAYRSGRSIRYIRSEQQDSGKLRFYLTAVSDDDIHLQLLEQLQKEDLTLAALQHLLVRMTECSAAEAGDYLDFLLSQQFLYSRRQGDVLVTGDDCVAGNAASPFSPRHVLLPQAGLLARQASSWLAGPGQGLGMPSRGLYYAAAERPLLRGGVAEAVQGQLETALQVLNRLAPSDSADSDLERFKQAFRQRFDREKVPLLLALDPDSGISYGEVGDLRAAGGWIRDIAFRTSPAGEAPSAWTALHRLFIRRWVDHPGRQPGQPIVLTDDDLNTLPETEPLASAMPPSLAVMFSRTRGGKLIIDAAGGATATSLIGRFSVFSPDVEALCTRLAGLEQESNPGVLFADIAQRTDDHVDNINRRRPVYRYCIPVNTFSELPRGSRIALHDLRVFLEGDDLILESVSLGKRIIPRLTTAYNFRHNDLGVFRFLCDLQYQGIRGNFGLDLEVLFPGLSSYPRVAYENTILCPAKWHFTGDAVTALTARPFSVGRLHLFRQQHAIPAWVTLGHSDQQLTFDLGDDTQAVFFLHCISGLSSMVLREYLAPDDALRISGQPFSSQGIAFLHKKTMTYSAPLAPARPLSEVLLPERRFLPGSDWLYIKVYCMPAAADQFLTKVLRPVLEAFRDQMTQWFFIRYQDPAPHLRLRFRLSGTDAGGLLRTLNEQISISGFRDTVREMQTDSYLRELERYGPELIGDVESFFRQSSEWVLHELIAAGQEPDTITEVPFEALALSYRIACRFLPVPEALERFLAWRASAMEQEYENAAEVRRSFDSVYRRLRPELSRVLEDAGTSLPDTPHPNPALVPLLEQAGRLAGLTSDWPEGGRFQLAGDLIHMQLNRIFASAPRQQEALVFHCLHKHTVSRIARRR